MIARRFDWLMVVLMPGYESLGLGPYERPQISTEAAHGIVGVTKRGRPRGTNKKERTTTRSY